MDNSGKHISYEYQESYDEVSRKPLEELKIPQIILEEFTYNAISTILSKDEIPNLSECVVLDGYSYNIEITCGDVKKEYCADEAEIQTYPLLRHLANWYKTI